MGDIPGGQLTADYSFNLMMVGEPKVGRTSLGRRFASQSFVHALKPNSIKPQYWTRTIMRDGKRIHLKLWHQPGFLLWNTVHPNFFRNADCVLLLFSTVDMTSFDMLYTWLEVVENHCSTRVLRVAVGTKIDLECVRTVTPAMIGEFRQEHNMPVFEVSALRGTGVAQAFESIVDLLVQQPYHNMVWMNRRSGSMENFSQGSCFGSGYMPTRAMDTAISDPLSVKEPSQSQDGSPEVESQ